MMVCLLHMRTRTLSPSAPPSATSVGASQLLTNPSMPPVLPEVLAQLICGGDRLMMTKKSGVLGLAIQSPLGC